MTNVQAVAGGRAGFVRAVFSSRCRGFAAPLDLVRVHLRAVVRVGWRRRVSAEFSGYLVTDTGAAVVPMFSQHRAAHEYGILPECVTGAGGVGFFYEGLRDGGGPIDAPGLMPAGSMCGADFGGVSSVVKRGAGQDAGAVLVWRWEESGRVVVLGRVRTGRAMAGDDGLLRPEFKGDLSGAAIDAPDMCLTGAMGGYAGSLSGRCAQIGRVWRAGVFR